MDKLVFVRLDGDRIGDSIELALLNGEFRKAQDIHNSVQQALLSLEETIHSIPTLQILLRGADDILFCMQASLFNFELINNIRKTFALHTSFTLSVGVGDNIRDTLLSLHRAKLSGRNKIVDSGTKTWRKTNNR